MGKDLTFSNYRDLCRDYGALTRKKRRKKLISRSEEMSYGNCSELDGATSIKNNAAGVAKLVRGNIILIKSSVYVCTRMRYYFVISWIRRSFVAAMAPFFTRPPAIVASDEWDEQNFDDSFSWDFSETKSIHSYFPKSGGCTQIFSYKCRLTWLKILGCGKLRYRTSDEHQKWMKRKIL